MQCFVSRNDNKNMRKGIFAVLILLTGMLLTGTGCQNKSAEDNDTIDSIVRDTTDSTLSVDDSLVVATPMPKRADELFDDFFFNFYINKKLQQSRIQFPLTVTEGKETRKIEREEWTMDHFFRNQEFYSIIAPNERGLRYAADTTVHSVVVERLRLSEGQVKQFFFNRVEGLWKMQNIKVVSMAEHGDSDFLTFFYRFATDEGFQRTSLADKIRYTGPADEYDERTVTKTISKDEWDECIHVFPDNFEEFATGEGFYDIVYGGTQKGSSTRVVSFRGLSNGNELKYTFSHSGGEWKLTKYEM